MPAFGNRRKPKLERRRDRAHRYIGSNRMFSSYYTFICLRCGAGIHWSREHSHDKYECDLYIRTAEQADRHQPGYLAWLAARLTEHMLIKELS